MNRSTIRLILGLIVGLSILVIVVSSASNQLSRKELTVNYQHVSRLTVYRGEALSATQPDPRPIATITSAGKVLKLVADSYTLRYEGEEGYESGFIVVNLSNKYQSVTINPAYSEGKLASILQTELPAITSVLATSYPKLSLYQVQPGQLYQRGEWYGTTLIYLGDDYFNTDVLRVILHKENNRWVVKTNLPSISLSKVIYPDIPKNVLSKVNRQ